MVKRKQRVPKSFDKVYSTPQQISEVKNDITVMERMLAADKASGRPKIQDEAAFRNEIEKKQEFISQHAPKELVGKKSNRSGYGAAVEVASGGHYQRQTYGRSPARFGLGGLSHVDVVRVTWPNGVVQNVIQPKLDRVLSITETVRISASCGFLYAFNGEKFELINEILGVGPLSLLG